MSGQDEMGQLFADIAGNIDTGVADEIGATIQFDLGGENGGLFWLKLGEGQALSGSGPVNTPSMTLRASAEDWKALVARELNPMTAFMTGRIKVQGDMSVAMKLQALMNRE